MNTDPVYIPIDSTRKRQGTAAQARKVTITCIKLVAYLSMVAGVCYLLTLLITKEVVIAIGLILGFLIVSTVLKFALSVIFTVIKWIVVVIAIIAILSVI